VKVEKSNLEKKIYYHDTDCGGVVYYANYLKYLEEARSEFFLERGISLKDLAAQGVYFVVAHTQLDYKSPARYQDIIKVDTAIDKVGRCSLDFNQDISRQDVVLVLARTTLVCVNKEFKPIPLPEGAREKLS
jgi:acyl-CoA thioester hydrolase